MFFLLDSLVDYIGDAAKGLSFLWTEKDEKKKSELKIEFIKVGVQNYLKTLERELAANNNGEGFFVGAKPTWADFVVVVFLVRDWSIDWLIDLLRIDWLIDLLLIDWLIDFALTDWILFHALLFLFDPCITGFNFFIF